MRLTLALFAVMVAAPALANSSDQAAPALDDVLSRAREAKKPVLLDFSTVWWRHCKLLGEELHKPDNAKLLEAYVFQKYDAERGAGAAAAAKYGVTSYPTLLVVDDQGTVLVKQIGLEPEKVNGWLKVQAAALRTEPELEAHVKDNPSDVDALWLLARRAEARGDLAAMRGWLLRIESSDLSKDRAEAAKAGWKRIESELDEKLRNDVRAAALDYVKKYPVNGDRALKALAAAGADVKTVEAELAKVIENGGDDVDLNGLVYFGLSIGAFDGAQLAAEKQLKLDPKNPNAYDTLAEVFHYRGDKARAVETERKGMEIKDISPALQAAMSANLKRFESGGGGTADVPPRPMLASPLVPQAAPSTAAATPLSAATRLYTKSLPLIAKACEKQKKKLDEAYVRIRVGDGKVEDVEVLEPSAPKKLKKCLAQAIRAVKVPAEQKPARVTIAVKL